VGGLEALEAIPALYWTGKALDGLCAFFPRPLASRRHIVTSLPSHSSTTPTWCSICACASASPYTICYATSSVTLIEYPTIPDWCQVSLFPHIPDGRLQKQSNLLRNNSDHNSSIKAQTLLCILIKRSRVSIFGLTLHRIIILLHTYLP